MTNSKKTSAKPKTKSRAKNKPVNTEAIVEGVLSVEEPTVVEESVKPEKPTAVKKVFKDSDGILCRSLVQGKLFVDGAKTGMHYIFADYGDETEIEYKDLVAAVRTKNRMVYTPYFVILDNDFISEFPDLDDFYTKRYKLRDLKEIIKLPADKIKSAIEELPPGAINSLKSVAATAVINGELDSNSKIKTLSEMLGVDLTMVSELAE